MEGMPMPALEILFRWIHVLAGVIWIGHLYFFNFVNAPFQGKLDGPTKKAVNPELLPRARAMAALIASVGQIAVRMALKSVNITEEVSLSEGEKLEASLFGVCCGTHDFREGTTAFLEKRKPRFTNS